MHGSRRVTAAAALPSTSVDVPAELGMPQETSVDSVAASQIQSPLPRTNTLPDLPLRIASRPIYGPRPSVRSVWPRCRRSEARIGNVNRPQRSPIDTLARGRRAKIRRRSTADSNSSPACSSTTAAGSSAICAAIVDPHAEPASARADAAATGLALLAFFGAGHDHFDSRFRLVIQDGLHFLLRAQQRARRVLPNEFSTDDGRPTGQLTRFYSHGIATLALSEAFGMTGDAELRAPAQRALDYLAGTQHPEPGGWRYLPGVDADASAIGWQLATLRSGQLAGLNVRPETISQIRDVIWRRSPRAKYESRQPNTVTTAVGLAVELHLGGSPGDERLRPAADQLLAHPPEVGDPPADRRQLARSTIPSAIPITGTTAPRRCTIWAATIGRPGRSSSTRS